MTRFTLAVLLVSVLLIFAGCNSSTTSCLKPLSPDSGLQLGFDPANGEKTTFEQLWICPNPGYTEDYMEMFYQPEKWAEARKYVDVFQMYDWRMLLLPNCFDRRNPEKILKPSDIDAIVSSLKKWDIDICFESGSLKEWGHTADKTYKQLKETIDLFESHGGKIKYIVMDQPYWAGLSHIGTFNMQQSLDVSIEYINLIKAHDPDIIVGDTEPYPAIPLADLKAWIIAFKEQTGHEFPFFHIDTNRADPAYDVWDVKELQRFCRERGIRFGVQYTDTFYNSQTDFQFYRRTIDYATGITAIMGLPDNAIIQSWEPMPSHALPDNANYSFMQLVRDFASVYKEK